MQTIQIHRILCPVDFSDCSRRAFEHAVAVATWYDSTITLLHVGEPVPAAAYSIGSGVMAATALTPKARDTILTTLKRFTDSDTARKVPIEFDVAEGPPATEILRKAAAMPADLLVMGTHGRSGFERLILGSITEKVLRTAACPVLTVPPGGQNGPAGFSALFKQIVCAVDFSECSLRALNHAMSLAQETGATLTVVHVMELPPELPREVHEIVFAGPRSLEEYVASARQDRLARLNDAVPEAVRAYCAVDMEVPAGTPHREISRIAEERRADLIVVGVHGRGAVDRLLFGSTAQHLVRGASCPVLTLRRG